MPTNGLVVMTPTSVVGSTATINADGSVSFTAESSLKINGVFTADYDNYMISVRHVSSAEYSVYFRLAASGVVEQSASNYYTNQTLIIDGTSKTGTRSSNNYGNGLASSAQQRSGNTVYVYGPYLAEPTAWRNVSARGYLGATMIENVTTHSLSTSYDGFELDPSSGTFTGLLTVFGFNQ